MNRTVQFLGWAYGAENISTTVVYDGSTVFSGSITPVAAEYPGEEVTLTPPFNVLLTFEIPVETAGSKPVSVTTSGGQLMVLGATTANYNSLPTWTGSSEYLPYTQGTATGFASIIQPATPGLPEADCRSNVTIDGVPQERPTHENTFNWILPSGSTIAFDLQITAGQVAPFQAVL